MKSTIFYTATFLVFLLANCSMAMSKSILSVSWCSIRLCGKISQPQGAHTRS